MKTYTIVRSSSGQVGVTITQDSGRRNAVLLKHCVLHSPTGFETGYSGSGPADLAASILADHFGIEPDRMRRVWEKSLGDNNNPAMMVIRLHQLFKASFIAPRHLDPGESYEITSVDIADWCARHEK